MCVAVTKNRGFSLQNSDSHAEKGSKISIVKQNVYVFALL